MVRSTYSREYGKIAAGVGYAELSREQLIEEAKGRGLAIAAEAEQRGPLADYPVTREDLVLHLEAHDRYLGLEPPHTRVAG
jgi:acetylornithine/succinyldiaminopimelate/putrescine aminotransferase